MGQTGISKLFFYYLFYVSTLRGECKKFSEIRGSSLIKREKEKVKKASGGWYSLMIDVKKPAGLLAGF